MATIFDCRGHPQAIQLLNNLKVTVPLAGII
jgi:hypothetical protein